MQAIITAHAKTVAIVAEQRIWNGLIHKLPAAAYRMYKLGEEVLAYSENQQQLVKPLIVVKHKSCMAIASFDLFVDCG